MNGAAGPVLAAASAAPITAAVKALPVSAMLIAWSTIILATPNALLAAAAFSLSSPYFSRSDCIVPKDLLDSLAISMSAFV